MSKIAEPLICFCILNQNIIYWNTQWQITCHDTGRLEDKYILQILKRAVNAATCLWSALSFHTPQPTPPSSLNAGLTLCHWETEGIHRAGSQDSASGVGQCRKDHPAEEPGLWGREHNYTNTGEGKLYVKTHRHAHTHTHHDFKGSHLPYHIIKEEMHWLTCLQMMFSCPR